MAGEYCSLCHTEKGEVESLRARIAELEGVKMDEKVNELTDAYRTIFDAFVSGLKDRGFLIVPREPTEEMMRMGDQAIIDGLEKAQFGIPYGTHPEHASHDVWSAMLKGVEG